LPVRSRLRDERARSPARRARADRGNFVRDVNEIIGETAERIGAVGTSWRFLCECGRRGCRATVDLTLDEYVDITGNGFLVAAEHRTPDAA
jgi:hypothetical protein